MRKKTQYIVVNEIYKTIYCGYPQKRAWNVFETEVVMIRRGTIMTLEHSTFKFSLWGPYALFSRPELKVERCSYDVITPSAARGVLDAIYWHPGMRWVIDKIYVKNPIRFTTVRRNEIRSKLSANSALQSYNGSEKPLYVNNKTDVVQRLSILLCDVSYVVEAHFEMTERANATDNHHGKI